MPFTVVVSFDALTSASVSRAVVQLIAELSMESARAPGPPQVARVSFSQTNESVASPAPAFAAVAAPVVKAPPAFAAVAAPVVAARPAFTEVPAPAPPVASSKRRGRPPAPKPTPKSAARAPAPPQELAPLSVRYAEFVAHLPERSRRFLALVEERDLITLDEAMRELGLTEAKAMGGVTGSMGRWAPTKNVPLPFVAVESGGQRAWRWVGILGVTRVSESMPAPPVTREPKRWGQGTPGANARPPVVRPPIVRSTAQRATPDSSSAMPSTRPTQETVLPVNAPRSPVPPRKPAGPAAKKPTRPRDEKLRAEPIIEVKGKGQIIRPVVEAVAPVVAAPAPASPTAKLDAYLRALPDASRRFMEHLRSRGEMTMSEALRVFSLSRPKAIGGIIEPIKRLGREHGFPEPIETVHNEGSERSWRWPSSLPAAPLGATDAAPVAAAPVPSLAPSNLPAVGLVGASANPLAKAAIKVRRRF